VISCRRVFADALFYQISDENAVSGNASGSVMP